MVEIRELLNDWLKERDPFRNCITESYMSYMIIKILELPGTVTVYQSQFYTDYPSGPLHWFVGYKEMGKEEIYIDGYQNKITHDLNELGIHPNSIKPVGNFEETIQNYTPRRIIRKLNRKVRKKVLVQLIHDRKWLRGLD